MGRPLQLVHQGITATHDSDEITIGRSPVCDVVLADDSVAPVHATLGRVAGEYLLRAEEGTARGVERAGEPLKPGRWWWLATGDVLQLGAVELLVGLPAPEPGARLIGVSGLEKLQAWPLDASKGGLLVGRSEECDVQLSSALCSRRHASLKLVDGSWWIADEGSTSGIYVRGVRVTELRLVHGDEVQIGGTALLYLDHGHPGAAFGAT